MAQAADQFEVWVDDFRRRALDSVFDEADLAIGTARKLFRERRLKSVEVERVSLRRLGGEDRTSVFREERQDERKQVALSADFDGRVLCHTVDDLYAEPAQAVIGRVLRGYLDHQGLTAIELLHDPQQAKRLNNYSSLRARAISLVAAAQARENGLDVEIRRKDLEGLVDQAVSRVRSLLKKSQTVDLGKGLSKAMSMDSYYDDETSREFILYAALTRHLAAAKGWGHKLHLVLDLFDDSAPQFALGLLDRFIADLLHSTAAVRAFCGEHQDLAPALVDLAHLGQGRLAQGYDTSPAVAPLNDHIAAGRLPATRVAIIDRIVHGLESALPLTAEERGSVFDALCTVNDALTGNGGELFGGDRMKTALDLRCSRLTQMEVDRRLAETRKPGKRIDLLLEFAGHVHGARSRVIVMENLESVIRTADQAGKLVPPDCPPLDGLQVLAGWQRRVDAVAALDNGNAAADAVSAALDQAATRLLEERHLLGNLMAGTVSASSRLEAMTALCRSDVVSFRQATDLVRRRVYEILRAPAFLASLASEGRDESARDARMRDLQTLLRDSGVV